MTDKQPEALRWADVLVLNVGSQLINRKQAAAELRRLHEENEQLKEFVVAEREACAKLCDLLESDMVSGRRTKDGDQAALTAAILSERIRARGRS